MPNDFPNSAWTMIDENAMKTITVYISGRALPTLNREQNKKHITFIVIY